MAQYSQKDKKIIDENEGVSPHDLLTVFGLSEKGFNTLVAERAQKATAAATASRIIPSAKAILIPDLSHLPPLAPMTDEKVRVIPVSWSGPGVTMSKKHALDYVSRYPHAFKIAD